MPVVIRLTRQGAKKQPKYLIVATDKASKRDGEYLQKIGHYMPKAKENKDKIKLDVAAYEAWKAKGAVCSQTVGQLIKTLSK